MNGINGINTRTQLVNRDNELAAMRKIGGRYALVMNDPELAAMAAGQGIRVIYRESGDAPEDDPLKTDPEVFVRLRHVHAPDAAYIHLLNEIDPSTDEQKWNREALKVAKSINRKCVVGNYSTHRSREQWEFARPLLAETVGAGHAVSFHHYVPPGNAAGGIEWITVKSGVGGLWLCTEFAFGRYTAGGQIDAHRGWRGITSPEERWAFIEKWSAYYSAKNIALLWWCFDWWDQPSVEVAKAEGFGYNDLPDVLDSLATFNKIYTVKDVPTVPTVNIPSNPGDGVAAEVITSGLRMRADANGAYLRAFVHGERVTLFPDTQKTVPGSAYTWAFLHDGFNNPGWAAPKDLNGTVWINPVKTLDTPIKKLDVPYNSQSDPTAKRFKNDCGAAACLMMLRYAFIKRGLLDPVKISVDDMASDTSLVQADDGLTVQELKALMAGYGLAVDTRADLKPKMIRALIDADQPILALVNYGLYNPPDTFNGGHFCVITAYGARGYWTHDPYSGGADFYVSNEVLEASMRDVLAFANNSYEGLTLAA